MSDCRRMFSVGASGPVNLSEALTPVLAAGASSSESESDSEESDSEESDEESEESESDESDELLDELLFFSSFFVRKI